MDKKEKAVKDLRGFLQTSGWTHDKLASKLGVHPQSIGHWMRGRFKPSLLALPLIEGFLKRRKI